MVQHMRKEQQMVRDWVEAQSDQQQALQDTLEAPRRPRPSGTLTPLKRVGEPRRGVARQGRHRDPPRNREGAEPMAVARAQARHRPHRLLAGLRRRHGDAAARLRLPAVGLHARAVLPRPGGHRQGHGAEPPERADRRADRAAGARDARQARTLEADARRAAGQPRPTARASATACRACSTPGCSEPARPGAAHRRAARASSRASSRSASGRSRRSSS